MEDKKNAIWGEFDYYCSWRDEMLLVVINSSYFRRLEDKFHIYT